MNIFVLDKDPQRAAHYHNDKHVVKMIMESAQILCTVHHKLGGDLAVKLVPAILKPTHANHPVVIWAGQSHANYTWLHELMKYLGQEYRQRYNGQHAYTHTLWNQLLKRPMSMEGKTLTPFAQCMPEQYRQPTNVVEAYRDYYFFEKQHIASWRQPSSVPDWWLERARKNPAFMKEQAKANQMRAVR